jgi:precorrin-2/cobalt-factor-2 C20-methyltransferase
MTHEQGRLTGVGVGPGDPSLLTRRATDVLSAADRVVAPTTGPDSPGRAETVVHQVLPELAITRLPFSMTPDASTSGEAARAASHRSAANRLLPWLESSEEVAFVTLGDPNIYSTFSSLVAALRELGCRVPVDTVPGITAFQALAAASGTVLLDGTEALSLVTALDGTAPLAEALAQDDRAVVIYKGGRHVPEMASLVAAHDRMEGAVVGELLGLPGERICPLAEAADSSSSYLATLIVPPRGRRASHGARAGGRT